jgi:Photosynthetic reaction centre cytochrome C subunit
MIYRKRVLAGLAIVSLLVPSAAWPQQWSPSPPSNLKVLASTTTVRELLPVMKGFTQGLGVRCQHCHVYKGENPDDLSSFDFASDEKAAKVTTRSMMRMSRVINDELLKGVGEAAATGESKVTCYTCHRGDTRPLNKRPGA